MAAKTLCVATALVLTVALSTIAYAQRGGGGGGGGGGFRGGGGMGGGGMSRGGGFGGGHIGGGAGFRGGGGGFGGRAIGAPQVGGGGFGGRGLGGGQAFRPGFVGRPGSLGRPAGFGRPVVGSRVITGHRQVIIRQGPGVNRVGGLSRVDPGARDARRFAGAGGPNRANFARHGLRPRTIVNPAFHGRMGPRFSGLAFRGGFARHHFRFRHRARFFAIGFAGPLFWPYAYNDFYDYVFLPHAYDEFWPYAYEDVYQGMFGLYASAGGGGGSAGRRGAGAANAQAASGSICGEQLSGLTDLPIERIAQTVQPNETQRAALDDLKTAGAQAVEILHAACPTDLPSTPLGRLEAMEKRLSVMIEAVRTVRPKLDAFYQLLTDEQRARFNAVAQSDGGGAAATQEQRELSRLCTSRSELFSIDRIAQAVQPTEAQRGALDELKTASAKAADLVQADCPTYQALTPTGRVEAMEKRLATVLQGVRIVRPALENFWDALTDEQKARFNRLNVVAQR
jgi:hypothetical protein